MANGFLNADRTVLRITGSDRESFLEGLVSNAVSGTADGPVYAAMLSPQGKYLFDFILTRDDKSILLDVKSDRAQALNARLMMYRLRADVQIEDSGLNVIQGFDAPPSTSFDDPRTPDLGWRMYLTKRVQLWMSVSGKSCVLGNVCPKQVSNFSRMTPTY